MTSAAVIPNTGFRTRPCAKRRPCGAAPLATIAASSPGGESIRIGLDGQRSWHAQIRISAAPNGWHAMATSYWYGMGGGGYAPSVWNCTAYTTRDEAVEAGINELIHRFEGVRHQTGAPQNQSAHAGRMIDNLKAHLSQARQLTLF
jgi:hypothetical protein